MSEASGEGKAFVLFSAGPVQRFIASARTVRDLWTGSFLMAWLTRRAMEPIMRHPSCGPGAFVLPDMSRDPLPLDGSGGGGNGSTPSVRVACLPNRFLAEAPENLADELAQECKKKFFEAWNRTNGSICSKVLESLNKEIEKIPFLAPDWQESIGRLWQEQVDSFFDDQDVRVVVLRWGDFSAKLLQELLGAGGPTEGTPADRLWTDRMQMVFRLLAAQKAVRKVTRYQPAADPLGMYAPKCTLLGTYEQLGPAELSQSPRFWEAFGKWVHPGGIRLRRGERLCAPSLVKRFAWSAYLEDRLKEIVKRHNRSWKELRFEDTATVAAAEWLSQEPPLNPQEIRRKYGDWNGQWLHWNRRDQDKDDPCPEKIWEVISPIIRAKREKQVPPPTYYAILMIDGDRMGQLLNAQVGRNHPKKVSQTLANFALDHAETIVETHYGTLIYCGGDDLLALLPTSQVLACAREVRQVFSSLWHPETLEILGGTPPTLSAGIAIVHYKEDLRFALEQARQAEKQAKNACRNILCIRLCRRSGEHQTALCPWEWVEQVPNGDSIKEERWDFVDMMQKWVQAFLPETDSSGGQIPGASDRWAYHLYQELPILEGLDREAIEAELGRQMDRAEEATRKRLFGEDQFRKAGKKFEELFEKYHQVMLPRFKEDDAQKDGKILRHFLTLCQMASFLARRKEE